MLLFYFADQGAGSSEVAEIVVPSEIIMPFSGYLVSIGRFSLIGAATAGALGCNVGSTVAYYVAAKGGRPAHSNAGAATS
jgi:membrane protein DedA with SNARE-associated domain